MIYNNITKKKPLNEQCIWKLVWSLKNAPAATKTWWQCLWFRWAAQSTWLSHWKSVVTVVLAVQLSWFGWRGIHSDLFSGHTDLLQTKQEEHSWIQCINWQVTHWKGTAFILQASFCNSLNCIYLMMLSYVSKGLQRNKWLRAILVKTAAGAHVSNHD